jgi:hypothetical protein
MGRNDWIDASSMAMGLPLGIAVGLVLDNVSFGIPIGIVFAIAIHASRARKSADGDSAPEDRAP